MKTKTNGFSIVELMVVVSILLLIASISYPRFLLFRLKSARVEATMNLRAIHTVAQSFHAENGQYPSMIHGTFKEDNGPWMTHTEGLQLGFDPTNIEKLRYLYTLYPTGGSGNSIFDPTRQTAFTAVAQSYSGNMDGGETIHGSGPPIPMGSCPVFGENDAPAYLDNMVIYQDGHMRHYPTSMGYGSAFSGDSAKDCGLN